MPPFEIIVTAVIMKSIVITLTDQRCAALIVWRRFSEQFYAAILAAKGNATTYLHISQTMNSLITKIVYRPPFGHNERDTDRQDLVYQFSISTGSRSYDSKWLHAYTVQGSCPLMMTKLDLQPRYSSNCLQIFG